MLFLAKGPPRGSKRGRRLIVGPHNRSATTTFVECNNDVTGFVAVGSAYVQERSQVSRGLDQVTSPVTSEIIKPGSTFKDALFYNGRGKDRGW